MRSILATFLAAASAASLHARTAPSETAPEASAPESVAARVNALTPEQVQQALSAIQQRHVGAESIDVTALSRATLLGLIERLHPGAELSGGDLQEPAVVPFQSEILEDRVGYVRLGSLRTESIAQLDAALGGFGMARPTASCSICAPRRNPGLRPCCAGRRALPRRRRRFSRCRDGRMRRGSLHVGRTALPRLAGGACRFLDTGRRGGHRGGVAPACAGHAVRATTGGHAVEFEDLPLGVVSNCGWRLPKRGSRDCRRFIRTDCPDLAVPQDPAVRDAVLRPQPARVWRHSYSNTAAHK